MKKFLPLLLLLGIITLLFGTIEGTAQQVLRQSANDPQIQLATDTASALNQGASPSSLVKAKVDITKSRTPFISIYDKNGRLVATEAQADGVPSVPLGTLLNANGKEYNVVTWQPAPGLRFAVITVAAKDYYVLSGRSLKDAETREDKIMRIVLIGWIVSLLATVLWSYLQFGKESKGRKSRG